MSQVSVPVSLGELIDKITILEIKSERIADAGKLLNINRELELLNKVWQSCPQRSTDISSERSQLKTVNESLWEIEDRIRTKESQAAFDAEFVEIARSVYRMNDERAALKKKINVLLGSELQEEKSYADYSS